MRQLLMKMPYWNASLLRLADDMPDCGDGPAHAGAGSVRWQEVFALLAEKSYQGCLDYETPNPLLWAGHAMM
jgi:hypothetical protein